jgi:hypothetical protein
MATYAAFDDWTDRLLRDDYDDTYVRPMVSVLPDDLHDEDQHKDCLICHSFDFGARWVPDNGGAWVNSSSWQVAECTVEKYTGTILDDSISMD